jgi:hypothetical protein
MTRQPGLRTYSQQIPGHSSSGLSPTSTKTRTASEPSRRMSHEPLDSVDTWRIRLSQLDQRQRARRFSTVWTYIPDRLLSNWSGPEVCDSIASGRPPDPARGYTHTILYYGTKTAVTHASGLAHVLRLKGHSR